MDEWTDQVESDLKLFEEAVVKIEDHMKASADEKRRVIREEQTKHEADIRMRFRIEEAKAEEAKHAREQEFILKLEERTFFKKSF